MKLALLVLSFLGYVLAAPRPVLQRRNHDVGRRAHSPHRRVYPHDPVAPEVLNSTQAIYSPNWCGAVLSRTTVGCSIALVPFYHNSWAISQATWAAVTGTLTLPTLKAPSGSNTVYASAWVGIDGETCNSGILQAGVDFSLESGRSSYGGQ